jgi:hypothetical protein
LSAPIQRPLGRSVVDGRIACGETAIEERSDRTAQRYRRFCCRDCSKQFKDRLDGTLHRPPYPLDAVVLVVYWRVTIQAEPARSFRGVPALRCGIQLRGGAGVRGEADAAADRQLTSPSKRRSPAPLFVIHRRDLHQSPWRCCYLYRAIDRSRTLADGMQSETRDMAAAGALFGSAKRVRGVTRRR